MLTNYYIKCYYCKGRCKQNSGGYLVSNEKIARFNKQHFVVGLKQTLEALKKDQATLLIIAKDVETYLLARVFSQIDHKGIPITYFESKSALGEVVGINVSATIAALLNENQ